jgi:hypothetical protein
VKRNVHVIPHGEQWATKLEGARRVGRVFWTQAEAIERGRKQAKRLRCELLIHNASGQIREADSLGDDPFPPKG